jgi:hypothetical protein
MRVTTAPEGTGKPGDAAELARLRAGLTELLERYEGAPC